MAVLVDVVRVLPAMAFLLAVGQGGSDIRERLRARFLRLSGQGWSSETSLASSKGRGGCGVCLNNKRT